jgi:hypothetical protein
LPVVKTWTLRIYYAKCTGQVLQKAQKSDSAESAAYAECLAFIDTRASIVIMRAQWRPNPNPA